MIGFTGTSVTIFYSTQFQFTSDHALGFSFFISRLLVMDLDTEISSSITIKSSCHFFTHLEMPVKFPDSNSSVSVLHGTNLYSLISSMYFHWSFWQRIYNTFIMDKSSNHTLSLLRGTSNSSSLQNCQRLSLTANCQTVILGTLLYSRGTNTYYRKHVT
jgi:hypothetical protein